jgi:hypothetical protein
MTALRSSLIDQLKLRNYSARTIDSYVGVLGGLAKFYGTPPDRLVSFDLTTRTVTVKALSDPVATVVTFVNRRRPGAQGCTPGYWKNHTDSFAPTGYTPGTIVGTVFTGLLPSLATQTFLTALQGGGGSGELGAQQILLRAAVAALLNAAHPRVSYALTTAEITSLVNAALATHDRATILALASRLDAANNGSGGCPLN